MSFERYDNLRGVILENFSKESQALVDKALDFAAERLSGLSRYDGNPMLHHSVNVAHIVITEVGLGINSTIATLIHDVVRYAVMHRESDEQLLETTEKIKELFGEEPLGIAMGLCNISLIKLKTESEQADSFRELIISYSADPRVILIKLADRLEVMRSLEMFPSEKWHKKSWESLHLYAQIAHKLGLYKIKSQLEDISLKYLHPAEYEDIVERLRDGEAERNAFIEHFIVPIKSALDGAGIKYHIKSRTKSIYSIWNKIYNGGVPFEDIFDIFAIRVVVDSPREQEKMLCWMVYSLVSDCYMPNTERMKDMITIPKSNGYESLHTTVAAGDGRWVEIQIRTERMDLVAERGIAAHWRYKGVSQGGDKSESWFGRLRELMEETTTSIADRFDGVQSNDEIFVFTPNGDIRKLPEGSTLLDFAFDIHTKLGSTCVGGKINDRAGSIREVLKSGDIVSIHTQKNQHPKADWLSIVVTSKARNKIKSYLRDEKAQSAKIGREELERKLKNWKLPISIDEAVAHLCKIYKVRTGTQLYEMVGLQRIELSQIKDQLNKLISGEVAEQRRAVAEQLDREKAEKAEKAEKQRSEREPSESDALIIDEAIDNLDYKLGKCCNPIKGDDIFGFVTVSAGITIHRTDCPNASRLRENYPYRVIETMWRDRGGGAFSVR